MSKYTILLSGSIKREDGVIIYPDSTKYDYQEYLAWVEAGHTADIESTPVMTENKLMEAAMQRCEAWMSSQGFTPNRQLDLLSDLLDESTSTERKARIVTVKAWLKECKALTLENCQGVFDGTIALPVAPLKYEEV